MNILHVLSGDFLAGSETSTAALANEQAARGHRVLIASARFTRPVKARFIALPIPDRSPFRRFTNILSLAALIRRERIDVVHAHSRAASWVCHWACRLTRTPTLSTLHGRQHLHFSNRHFNVYGPYCAAVCENIREQMLRGTRVFKPGQIKVIRNGIKLKGHG